MFTMSRLFLVMVVLTLTKFVNLTAILLNSPLFNNAPLFGVGRFDLYKRPEHIKEIETLRRVHEATPHPGLKYFQPHGEGKTLIVLDDFGVLLQLPSQDYFSAEALLKDLAANKKNEVWLYTARGEGSLIEAYKKIPGINIAAEYGTVLYLSQSVEPKMEIIVEDTMLSHPIKFYMNHVARSSESVKMTKLDSKSAAAYFYDTKTPEEFDPVAAEIRKKLGTNFAYYELRRDDAKSVVEIKHIEADKGNFIDRLLGTGRYTKGVAIGNPTNSDGMFRAMNHANRGTGDSFHSVVVTEDWMRQTAAKYTLRDFHEAHKLLRELIPSWWDKIKAIFY
ncbi:hypothetical protein PTTG_25075 [Puccinia triticina 1-1 BBBD Race 1]|uniref:Trehalose-phosphatase n=2 Tax=Puccinia triticina TaxID=208348 RepID=A0A180H4W2_PUCT1|nr:uncharacterized protein PtA15_9A376 [Puccinia triticina]OAV99861.1 hypothetical protein PTTG_25075 [Puccinia triticina 1-1 BBBD Race 1]WAQ88249.1 hypothetical protein PtA15_9A376 [Puccinia triticina]